jgi:ribonuclease P protein component
MQTFRKQERLCNHKIIDHLFKEGKSFRFSPFMVIWDEMHTDINDPLKVLITVSKKNLRLSVQRNYIKRVIREAYRLNKHGFAEYLANSGRYCSFTLIYTGPEKLSLKDAESKIILILRRLQSEYEKTAG